MSKKKFSDSFFDPFAVPLQDVATYAIPASSNKDLQQYLLSNSEYVPPNSPEQNGQVQLKRCKRCEVYYHDGDESMCRWHPGKYKSVLRGTFSSISISKWSCCRKVSRTTRPCKTSHHHLECELTSSTLGQLPVPAVSVKAKKITSGSSLMMPQSPPVEPISPCDRLLENWRIRVESSLPKSFGTVSSSHGAREIVGGQPMFKHFVDNHDTLFSLSVKYKVKPDEIQKVNKLCGPIYSRYFLWIPDYGLLADVPPENPEAFKKRMILRFRTQVRGSSRQEAEYYLEDKTWDVDKAVEQYHADMAWERANGPRQGKRSIPV